MFRVSEIKILFVPVFGFINMALRRLWNFDFYCFKADGYDLVAFEK